MITLTSCIKIYFIHFYFYLSTMNRIALVCYHCFPWCLSCRCYYRWVPADNFLLITLPVWMYCVDFCVMHKDDSMLWFPLIITQLNDATITISSFFIVTYINTTVIIFVSLFQLFFFTNFFKRDAVMLRLWNDLLSSELCCHCYHHMIIILHRAGIFFGKVFQVKSMKNAHAM